MGRQGLTGAHNVIECRIYTNDASYVVYSRIILIKVTNHKQTKTLNAATKQRLKM